MSLFLNDYTLGVSAFQITPFAFASLSRVCVLCFFSILVAESKRQPIPQFTLERETLDQGFQAASTTTVQQCAAPLLVRVSVRQKRANTIYCLSSEFGSNCNLPCWIQTCLRRCIVGCRGADRLRGQNQQINTVSGVYCTRAAIIRCIFRRC